MFYQTSSVGNYREKTFLTGHKNENFLFLTSSEPLPLSHRHLWVPSGFAQEKIAVGTVNGETIFLIN